MSKAIASKMDAILARLDSIESRLEKEKEAANEKGKEPNRPPTPIPRSASHSPSKPLSMARRRSIL